MSNILSTIADEYIQELSVFDEEAESWDIKDALAADWALDKIREAKADHSRNEMIVNDKIKQLQSWLAKEKKRSDATISYFTWKLEEFFNTVPNKKATKTQEVCKLPSGTLKRRFQKPEYVRDDEKLLAWLKEHGQHKFIKVKESPDWAGLKGATKTHGNVVVDENGEVVDGVKIIERDPIFEVEV